MLIRVIGHFRNNPKHIDKMIAIKGLPEEWIFRDGPEGKELAHPWKADIDKNIPSDIRHLCEPTYLVFRYPPIEKGAAWVIEKRQILGIVLDFMTEPGREMWEKIERYLEGTIPRNERVPDMVVLAKDEHSPFETYMPRRDSMNHLYFEQTAIPEIDLRIYGVKTLSPIGVKTPEPVLPADASPSKAEVPAPPASEFKCQQCDYTHKSKRGVGMHTMKRHPAKEKVGAT